MRSNDTNQSRFRFRRKLSLGSEEDSGFETETKVVDETGVQIGEALRLIEAVKCTHLRLIVGAPQRGGSRLLRQLAVAWIAELQRGEHRHEWSGIARGRIATIGFRHLRSPVECSKTGRSLAGVAGPGRRRRRSAWPVAARKIELEASGISCACTVPMTVQLVIVSGAPGPVQSWLSRRFRSARRHR